MARPPCWRVYVLRCGDGSLYTGATNDLARRLCAHEGGKGCRYTRSRLPVTLVHVERVRDRGAALRREAEVKRLTRAEKLALISARAGSRPRDVFEGRPGRSPPPGSRGAVSASERRFARRDDSRSGRSPRPPR